MKFNNRLIHYNILKLTIFSNIKIKICKLIDYIKNPNNVTSTSQDLMHPWSSYTYPFKKKLFWVLTIFYYQCSYLTVKIGYTDSTSVWIWLLSFETKFSTLQIKEPLAFFFLLLILITIYTVIHGLYKTFTPISFCRFRRHYKIRFIYSLFIRPRRYWLSFIYISNHL